MVDLESHTGTEAPAALHPIAHDLLAWYASEQRDLPWRRTRDPYRIWVSEVMLIQTQVATVIPYYERFLRLFPDVAALAAAPLDAVLKAWEGLGYYARARNLHRAAQQVVAVHGGELPREREALRRLPGLGAYATGAILSIAFGQDEPAVDGNVRRIVARIEAWPEASDTEIEARLRELLPRGRAGDFNQALMDLGATICTSRRPRCLGCPVAAHCRAQQQGRQEELPAPRRRPAVPHYEVTAAVIERAGRVLITQRPAEGLLGGLWEFPGGKQEPGETLPECLAREIREELGVEIEVGAPLVDVEHGYTHFSITLHAFRCRLPAGEPRCLACKDARWVTLDELDGYAFSAADRRIIQVLRG